MSQYKTAEEALEALIEAAGPLTLVGEGIATLDERDLSEQQDAVSFGDLEEHTRIQINQEWGVFVRLYQATLQAKAFLLEQQLREKAEQAALDARCQSFEDRVIAQDVGISETQWISAYASALYRGGCTQEQVEYFLIDGFDYTEDPEEIAHQTLVRIGKVVSSETEDVGIPASVLPPTTGDLVDDGEIED